MRKKSEGVMPAYYYKAEHLDNPKNYSDESWIRQQLQFVPQSDRQRVARAYSRIYKLEYDKEEVEYRKDGKARFAANTFLRDEVSSLIQSNTDRSV